MQVPRQGGESGGDASVNAGEALPPVVRHSLAVDEPLLEAAKGDVDGEIADLRRVVHRRARGRGPRGRRITRPAGEGTTTDGRERRRPESIGEEDTRLNDG